MSEEYTITIKVSKQELEDALYGSREDFEKLGDKVIEEAKKQGFKEFR